MAPPKSTRGTPPSADPKRRPPQTAPPAPAAEGERYAVKPEVWDQLFDSLPPWIDEIAAIMLIVFGGVSLMSLLNVPAPGDATISTAWANALSQLFGYGSAIVCVGITALGGILLLKKVGRVVRFPTRRVLAIEVAFLSILALLHLAVNDSELRSVARLGRGGGQVGWALSSIVTQVVGSSLTVIFYAVLLTISLAIVAGLNRTIIANALSRLRVRLEAYAARTRPTPLPAPTAPLLNLDAALQPSIVVMENDTPALQSPAAVAQQRVKAYSIMRVRPDWEQLPPSQRPGAPTEPAYVEDEALPIVNVPRPATVKDTAEADALFRRDSGFNVIGTLKPGKRAKGAPIMVERPDGRMKRYFPVDTIKEPKGATRRAADLPALTLLADAALVPPNEQEVNTNVVLIEDSLLEFDIDIDIVDVKIGPTVTQYAIQPFREGQNEDGETTVNRTRIAKIASLANDLALSLSAKRLRIEAPIAGTTLIGIEVPNKKPSVVALRSVYESRAFREEADKRKSPLFVPLGRDVSGAPVGVDLAAMPHLLIAGTTGSGKSVAMAALATALVLENHPDHVKLIMLDPKMVELSRFNGLPHLLGQVEVEQERIINVLKWCTREMDRRYKILEEAGARNISIYNTQNARRKDSQLPYMVIMIDEIGDLMLSNRDDTERTVIRLAQMARAVGMHLVVATQRPSVDVITGLIKANFPSRIAFAVASGTDSRVILDTPGAEALMGRGDMLFYAADATAPRRVQGCFVHDDEVRAIINYWRDWTTTKHYVRGAAPWEKGLTRREVLADSEPMLEEAIALVVAEGEASAALLQRTLNVGYPRAARIMDLLQELGIIGAAKSGERSREVLLKPEPAARKPAPRPAP